MKKRALTVAAIFFILTLLSLALASCGEGHTHTWGEWVTVYQSTCRSEGLAARACSCGAKDTQKLPKAEHTGELWIVERTATRTEDGKKHQLCSVCGEAFNEKAIPSSVIARRAGIEDKRQSQYRPSYNLSNCRNLTGTPVVVLLFVDDNVSRWSKNEVLTFMQEQILPGLDYLERNARKWGQDLDFIVESYSSALSDYEIKYEGRVNPDLYVGGSTKDVLDQAAADIGCRSNWDLYSYYKAKYPKNEIIFLNFLNKSGRSYARHAFQPGYNEYSEHCVIFADHYGSFPAMRTDGSRASTIVHEILHLYGAEDFYKPYAREQLANKVYPHDIMLWQYDNIEENVIGDCTAYSIGWTNSVPDVCYESQWWE